MYIIIFYDMSPLNEAEKNNNEKILNTADILKLKYSVLYRVVTCVRLKITGKTLRLN